MSKAKTIKVSGPLCLCCRKEMKPNDKVIRVTDDGFTKTTKGWCCSRKCYKKYNGFNEGSPANKSERLKTLKEAKAKLCSMLDNYVSDWEDKNWYPVEHNSDCLLEGFLEDTYLSEDRKLTVA